MVESTTDKGEEVNIYKGEIRPAIVIVLVVIVLHIAIAAIVVDEVDVAFWVVNITMFILYALGFAVMAFQATQITIAVYDKGIGWRRGSSHVFTTWGNIDRIGRKDEGDSATFGIFLHERVQPEVHSWLDRRLFAAPIDYIRLIPTVRVPTRFKGRDGNVIDWQALAETTFGQDVLRYAPHLLEM